MPRIWIDGRSGQIGQFVGDRVLLDLATRLGPVVRRKGTIFETASDLIVGRVCATDRYLLYPEVHWSTFDPGQERALCANRELAGRRFYYLFITGMPCAGAITYWLLPARVLLATIANIRPRGDGAVNVRIHEESAKSILNGVDVTRYRHRIELDPDQRAELEAAEGSQDRRPTRSGGDSSDQDKRTSPTGTRARALRQATVPTARASTVVIGSDGSLLLPASLRQQFLLGAGTRAVAYQEGQRIVLQPVRPYEYRMVRGTLKGTGAFKALLDERHREREALEWQSCWMPGR